MTIEKEVAAGDGGRELACRCGADLLAELHAAATASTYFVANQRLENAVRACEALVSELAAGRIELRPALRGDSVSEFCGREDFDAMVAHDTGVAERPALASPTAERPEGDSGADPDDGEILPGVRSRCCNAPVRGFVIGGPDAADITAWDQCDRCNFVLLDADVLRAGGSAGKETA